MSAFVVSRSRTLSVTLASCLMLSSMTLIANAQIYNWDTGEVIPGTESITIGPGLSLSSWNTDSKNLRYADFSGGHDLTNSIFQASWLDNANFSDAQLTDSSFWSTTLVGANFSNANLTNAELTRRRLPGISWQDTILTDANLSNANLTGADLFETPLVGANLNHANLTNTRLSAVDLTNADLTGAVLNGTNFNNQTGTGLTAAQLYSTASYQIGVLQNNVFTGLDMTDWDLSGQDLTNTSFYHADLTDADLAGATVTNVDFGVSDIRPEQLYTTTDYLAGDLSGIGLSWNNLAGFNLAGMNLTGADFYQSNMTDVNLTGAQVTEADLSGMTDSGFTAAQLYSTASYKAKDLHGMTLGFNTLDGWDLTDQNLTDGIFAGVRVNNTDMSRADTRGARYLTDKIDPAITTNTIFPGGRIESLDLGNDETMFIRDYDGDIAITINDGMALDPSAVLEIVFADAEWGSTMSLSDAIPVDLDGTLYLSVAAGVDPNRLVGVTFDVFNWNGQLSPGDAFAKVDWPIGYDWDIGDLYVGGTVTLIGVFEPGDCDFNGTLEFQDIDIAMGCLLGPAVPLTGNCHCTDWNHDDSIDITDFYLLQQN